MKKLLAFMMAFALCVLCFGTYGFEPHDHSAHALHALDDEFDEEIDIPEYVYMEIGKANYNELTKTLEVEVNIYCDALADVDSGKLTISAPNRILGEPRVVGGYIFGEWARNCAEVTQISNSRTTVTIDFEEGKSGESYIVLEYEVEDGYFQFSRQTYLEFSGYVITDNGKRVSYDPTMSSGQLFVCAHNDTATRVSVKPTCQSTGEQETYCTICNYVVSTKTLLTADHTYDYSKPINTKINPYLAATCSAQGYGTFECLVCKKVHSVTIPATPHQLGERFERNGHFWQACKVCNKEVYAENQCTHDASLYTLSRIEKQSTCSVAGSAIYKCPTCKQEESRALPLLDHTVTQWNTVTAATCTTAGRRAGACTTCSKTISEAIDPIGHSFGEWRTTKAPTCTEAGVQTRYCSNCTTGNETQPIAATGHSYGTWVTTKNATCVEAGIKKCICTSCGSERTDILPLTGHSFGPYTTTKEPTCTEKGIQTHTCLICSVSEAKEIAAVAGNHVYGDAVVITAKTCLTDGVSERTCAHCGEKKTEVVAAEGHALGAPTVNGKVSVRACACGYQESTKTVKKGVEKTLTCYAGTLEIVGAAAANDIAFELNVMPMADAANYKQYYTTFSNAYVFKLLTAGADTAFTSDMTLSINLDSTFEGYEAKVVVLRNGAFYPVANTETDDNVVSVNGQDLIGAEAIFVEKGEEIKPSFIIPLIITIVVIVAAAVVIVIILTKKGKKY